MTARRLRTPVSICLFFVLLSWLIPLSRADAAANYEELSAEIEAANRSDPSTITLSADIVLSAELPPIRGALTIEGGGHTISGDDRFPIFVVNAGRLTINNLTLAEGNAEYDDHGPTGAGALTAYNGAEVFVNDSMFIRNRSAQFGGAISVNHSMLTVNNSSFARNRATAGGGAIDLWHSNGDIRNSSFVNNSANHLEPGGAILVSTGVKLEVRNSSFSGNSADRGGAVATEVRTPDGRLVPSTTTLTHVTIMKNYARTAGNGISIHDEDRNFNLRNSIVAGARSLTPMMPNSSPS